MSEDDYDYREEERREWEFAQASMKRGKVECSESQVPRYVEMYQEAYTDYDIVWFDRKTGKEIIRYDGADPANTNSYYGACSDEEMFRGRSLDIYETIDRSEVKPASNTHLRHRSSFDKIDEDFEHTS